jgi:hypothetical protein
MYFSVAGRCIVEMHTGFGPAEDGKRAYRLYPIQKRNECMGGYIW